MKRDYWKPEFKWQLVEWFHKKYPHMKRWKWRKMTREQIFGKYKEEREHE